MGVRRSIQMRRWAAVTALLAAGAPAVAYYDAFPSSGGPYVSGPASTTLPWIGENFEGYANGQVIEVSNSMGMQPHLDVTSGTLESKYAGAWRRGWTDDSVFRAVAIGRDAQNREIKWTDQVAEYRGYVQAWHAGLPNYAGFHVFARYRTSNDLYVASLRYDGQVTIKRKWDSDFDGEGEYTDLAVGDLDPSYLDANGHLQTGRWYTLRFSAIGNQLKFSVDGNELLSATSGTFSWGTTGVRIDYANAYIDDWKLVYPTPEPSSAALLLGAAGVSLLARRRRNCVTR